MEHFLKNLPDPEILLMEYGATDNSVPEVNGHIHTPYSFSAFPDVPSIFRKAAEEQIKVLGINDFYTTGGYGEFHRLAVAGRVFPLFNIEYIALDREFQRRGIRVNDPNNPGRTYLSGKGLDFPPHLGTGQADLVGSLMKESNRQVREMVGKVNELLAGAEAGFRLDFERIRQEFAKELVRERHVAKALRIAVYREKRDPEEIKTLLSQLFGKEPLADPDNHSAVEIEIRNNLLKAGGHAFVQEDEKAFLSVDAVMELISHAGGIPCYPVLLDDSKGNFTDYERDRESLWKDLSSKGVFCIELIPGRNDQAILEEFVRYFSEKRFVVLLGTEHNTPDLAPLRISCRNGVALSRNAKAIGYHGACVIAAHQYFRTREGVSPVTYWSALSPDQQISLTLLGGAIIHHFTKQEP